MSRKPSIEIANRNAKIIAMYNEGHSSTEVAKAFNLTVCAIDYILYTNHVKTHGNRLPLAKRNEVISLLNRGVNFKSTAEQTGVSYSFVKKIAADNHIMTPAYVSPALKEKMLDMRAIGMSNKDIAERTGFSTVSVVNHIGCQPEEITKINVNRGAKLRSIANEAKKAACAAMLKKAEEEAARLERERIALIEAQRIEAERKSIQDEIESILGFKHEILTVEEGRNILDRIMGTRKAVA